MRNTLYKYSVLGAVAITSLALNIRTGFAAGDVNHAEHVAADGSEHADYHGAADAHYAEIDGLPQLDFSTYTSQIFWMFVAFGILYIFFAKKTLPDISSSIDTRREKVEGDLDNAKDLKEEASTVQATYEESLTGARDKAGAAFRDAETSMKAMRDKKLAELKARSEDLTQKTEVALEAAKKDALKDAQSVAAEIAQLAAEKIVGVSTDLEQAKKLVKNLDKKAA